MAELKTSDQQGGVCAAIAVNGTQNAITAVKDIENDVDVVEIRIDGMQEADIGLLCREINRPLLFTNRANWEGGNFTGTEEERLAQLITAIRHNAAYVDLELRTSLDLREQLLAEIHGSKTHLIISYHDFESTPDATELSVILQEQISSGAHIGKIVTMAHSHLDVLKILHLLSEAQAHDFPLITFCMGDAGRLSRIITLMLGGYMTYAALDEQQATAPGQLSVNQLRTAMARLEK